MEVDVQQAKIDLSKLIKSALEGESVIIINHGKSLVRIVPVQPKAKDKNRGYGMFKGQFTMPTDEEWKQMDQEIEDLFYGKDPGSK